jgi:hypothetical protein
LCAWKFHQVFKYKSISLLCVSYIHIQIKACHALDLALLVVTNWSMRDVCIESRFSPHIDTNYCVRRNFNRCLNISLFSPYMCHMFILKFENISCPWLGLVGGYKSINERHSSQVMIRPPHGYKLLCVWKFCQVCKYKSMLALYVSYVHAQIW